MVEEIDRLEAFAREIQANEVDPHQDEFLAAINAIYGPGGRLETKEDYRDNIARVERETGRNDAIDRMTALFQKTDALIDRMISTPARSNIGRAAKVRVLLRNVMKDEWRESLVDGDYEQERVVKILADLCGASPGELTKSAIA